MYWTSSPRPWPGFGADRFKSKIYLYVFRPSPEYYSERDAACMRSLHSEGKAERRMKSTSIGIGMLGGMALAVTAVNALYPDVWRRMKRDGKRAARAIQKSSLLK